MRRRMWRRQEQDVVLILYIFARSGRASAAPLDRAHITLRRADGRGHQLQRRRECTRGHEPGAGDPGRWLHAGVDQVRGCISERLWWGGGVALPLEPGAGLVPPFSTGVRSAIHSRSIIELRCDYDCLLSFFLSFFDSFFRSFYLSRALTCANLPPPAPGVCAHARVVVVQRWDVWGCLKWNDPKSCKDTGHGPDFNSKPIPTPWEGEDPSIWVDEDGHYHMVSHNGARGQDFRPTNSSGDCGRHYFSTEARRTPACRRSWPEDVVAVVVVVVVVVVVEAPSMAVAEEEAVEHAGAVEEPVDCCSLTVDGCVVRGAWCLALGRCDERCCEDNTCRNEHERRRTPSPVMCYEVKVHRL